MKTNRFSVLLMTESWWHWKFEKSNQARVKYFWKIWRTRNPTCFYLSNNLNKTKDDLKDNLSWSEGDFWKHLEDILEDPLKYNLEDSFEGNYEENPIANRWDNQQDSRSDNLELNQTSHFDDECEKYNQEGKKSITPGLQRSKKKFNSERHMYSFNLINMRLKHHFHVGTARLHSHQLKSHQKMKMWRRMNIVSINYLKRNSANTTKTYQKSQMFRSFFVILRVGVNITRTKKMKLLEMYPIRNQYHLISIWNLNYLKDFHLGFLVFFGEDCTKCFVREMLELENKK